MVTIYRQDCANDDLDDLEGQYGEYSANLRMGFIRRVYGLILFQILTDIAFTSIFIYYKPQIVSFLVKNKLTLSAPLTIMFMTIILHFISYFVPSLLNSYPTNILFFTAVTILEALTIAFFCFLVNQRYILLALVITSVSVIGLTMFAFQTKHDFTSYYIYIFYGMIALFVFSFIYLFFPTSRIIELIISPIGAIFFSFTLVSTTQSVIGDRKNVFYEDSYVSAALTIHSQIINIFIYVLRFIMALNHETR
ncbi:Grina-prov protein [Cryptosporidium ryanae]|uniref:Grina-prov protein n=1 Tax=Cryptosporidium ryanae TaxID=515981 RepID=UPI00351A9363|nr:Grina-prov protein [Cryptosporidium ryanae]